MDRTYPVFIPASSFCPLAYSERKRVSKLTRRDSNSKSMKTIKRKAKRITDRPTKKKITYSNIYAGSEEALLNKVVEIIVKIIKKEVGL